MASLKVPMASLRVVAIPLLLGSLLGSPAIAQSPTYGVGRTPTADEIRRMDISIGPTGEELPVGPMEISKRRSSSGVVARPTP